VVHSEYRQTGTMQWPGPDAVSLEALTEYVTLWSTAQLLTAAWHDALTELTAGG